MPLDRRASLAHSSLAVAAAALGTGAAAAEDATPTATVPRQRIGVSTYSFFKFGQPDNVPVDRCIELAADMGFDGVELLLVQMEGKENYETAVPKSLETLRKAFA